MERARMIGQGIFTSMETVQLYMPAVCCGDQRDLIVRIAVAVGILFFESFQHFVVFVDGGGHLQSQIIEPGLVDVHFLGVVAVIALVDAGHGIDGSVVLRDQFLDLGIICHQSGEVRHILFDQVVERGQITLACVLGFLSCCHIVGIHSCDNVWKISAGHGYGYFVSPGLRGNNDPVDMYVCHFLVSLIVVAGLCILGSRTRDHNGKLFFLLGQREICAGGSFFCCCGFGLSLVCAYS